MSDKADMDDQVQSGGGSLRARFPGFFPPGDDQLQTFLTQGLVAFDTNALFDVYRFSELARQEYLAALIALQERLWIPNRVAQELLERRLDVIRECAEAANTLTLTLERQFQSIVDLLREFGNRRGLSEEQVAELTEIAVQTRDRIGRRASNFYSFDLKLETSLKGDGLLAEIESIIDDKVGPPLENLARMKNEALRRLEAEVPPGFKDWKKDPDRAIGDCLIWFQLLREAKRRECPIVLVSNEKKQDWIRRDLGKTLGPHPQLVAEMQNDCGTPFHLMNVQSFLIYAKKYLGVRISDSTLAQAQRAEDLWDPQMTLTEAAKPERVQRVVNEYIDSSPERTFRQIALWGKPKHLILLSAYGGLVDNSDVSAILEEYY